MTALDKSEKEQLEILAEQMFDGPATVPVSYIERMAEKLVKVKLKALSLE